MEREALEGKTALVTGASRRIGRALAHAFAEAGMHVVIHYNSSAAEAEKTALEARRYGVMSWTLSADLAVTEDAGKLMDEAFDMAGTVDVLINNASVFPPSRLRDLGAEELFATIGINAMAPLALSREFAERAGNGSIVNMLDSRVGGLDLGHVAYQLSKDMLLTLTRMMAVEFAPGIRVNAIAPGLILAPEHRGDDYLEKLAEKTLLRRHGRLEDITSAALFLLSNGFMTGEVIAVDGGRNTKERSCDRGCP